MASSNLQALQATTNRFADKVGFSLISVDGGMGPLTQRAVAQTLEWVAGGGNFFDSMSPTVIGAAKGLSSGIGTGVTALTSTAATRIMANLVMINTTLTSAANELNLPSAAQPKPVTQVVPGGGVAVNPSTLNTTLTPPPPPPGSPGTGALANIARKLGMTTTQAVLLMAMIGGVGVLAVMRARRSAA